MLILASFNIFAQMAEDTDIDECTEIAQTTLDKDDPDSQIDPKGTGAGKQ